MKRECGLAIIVDDDPGVRQALETLILSAGIAVRSHDGAESLLEAGLPEGAACVILDLCLNGDSGVELQKSLMTLDPGLPVIFLSGTADVPSVVTALKGGAVDFLEKGSLPPEDLIRRLRSALEAHHTHLKQGARREELRIRIRTLSRREQEIALLVGWGKANKAVAQELGISERTVEIHRSHAMHKLGLRSVTDLARLVGELDELWQSAPRQ